MTTTTRRQQITATLAAAALAMAALWAFAPGVRNYFVGRAAAASSHYDGSVTSGTIVLKQGDPMFERTITNPPVTVSADVDDTTGAFTSSFVFQRNYTPVFKGPFNLMLYVASDITQTGAATGNVDPATGATNVTAPVSLAITVFNTTTEPGVEHPSTDQKLTDPATCNVPITFQLAGTFNKTTGALTLAQNPFTIPQFPMGCGVAQMQLNTQLAGPNNSVSLTFAGQVTTTTTSTSTTSTSTTSTTSTSTTSTTEPTSTSTTSTTEPTSTSTTSTTEPTSTSTTSTTEPTSTVPPTTAPPTTVPGSGVSGTGAGNGTGTQGPGGSGPAQAVPARPAFTG